VTGCDGTERGEGLGGAYETENIKKSMMNEVKLNYRIMWKLKYFSSNIMTK
jgi:hypothetical protein